MYNKRLIVFVDLPQKLFNNNINDGKLTMIFDSQSLMIKYKNYSNFNQKISIECKNGHLIRIKRGLYTDDLDNDKELIANVCYSPSYISFECALSYYGIIPEYVFTYTSAVYGKKNNKFYSLENVSFEYKSIPNSVFFKGIKILKNKNGFSYKIASKEKALCDLLYLKYSVRSLSDLKVLLFEDLRIDYDELMVCDIEFIKEIVPFYHSNTLNTFLKYMLGEIE